MIVGLVLMTVKLLLMDIERSKNEVKLQRLIQKIAILECELHAVSDQRSHDQE
jgi:hypothetical protein